MECHVEPGCDRPLENIIERIGKGFQMFGVSSIKNCPGHIEVEIAAPKAKELVARTALFYFGIAQHLSINIDACPCAYVHQYVGYSQLAALSCVTSGVSEPI